MLNERSSEKINISNQNNLALSKVKPKKRSTSVPDGPIEIVISSPAIDTNQNNLIVVSPGEPATNTTNELSAIKLDMFPMCEHI